MKKLNKVFVSLLLVVAFMLLLTVKTSAIVDEELVTNEIKNITFDAEYYLNSYPDLKAAFGNDDVAAYEHFLTFGISEGRCAKLTFNVVNYVNSYKDLKAAFGEDYEAAYKHFIEFGANEGRSGCQIYDASYYLSKNADVKAVFVKNYLKIYEHYSMLGIREGRLASPDFNVKCYLRKYADLKAAFTETGYKDGFEHFLTFGISEGRIGTHEYKETTVSATCTSDGYTIKECACGLDTIKTVIPALGHDFGDTEEATDEEVTETGYVHKHTCTRDDYTEYFDEEHTWSEEPVSTTATCTEAGIETYECTVCGKTEEREVEALGHSFELNTGDRVTSTTAATCTENGYDEYICSVDGAIKLVPVKALGHNLTHYEAKAATCEEEGNIEYYYCETCEKYFSDEEATTEIEETNITIEAIGHVWNDGEVTTEPTCIEKGVMTYTCTECGETKTEEIDALGHTIIKVEAKDATCIEDGNIEYYYCETCGKYFEDEQGETEITDTNSVVIPASEEYHNWVDGDVTDYGLTAPTCEEDGYSVKVCNICGDVEIISANSIGHDYEYTVSEEDETKHIATCKHDAIHTFTEEHNFGEVVASEDYEGVYEKVCEDCGYTIYYTDESETVEALPVTSLDELVNAISIIDNETDEESYVITLTDDITCNTPMTIDSGNDIVMNLNNNTLNINYAYTTFSVKNGSELTIENGTISESGSKPDNAVFAVATGSILNVENVTVTDTTGTAFYAYGDAAELNIINSEVKSNGYYAVGTNAGTTDNYNVVISIENSTLSTSREDHDNTAVYLNVAGTLNITNSTLTGDRQGMFVRAGKATITDSTINSTGLFTNSYRDDGAKWGSGNELSRAALVVGNYSSSAYLADAIVSLSGVTLNVLSDSETIPQLVVANGGNGYNTTVTGADTAWTAKALYDGTAGGILTLNEQVISNSNITLQSVESLLGL